MKRIKWKFENCKISVFNNILDKQKARLENWNTDLWKISRLKKERKRKYRSVYRHVRQSEKV